VSVGSEGNACHPGATVPADPLPNRGVPASPDQRALALALASFVLAALFIAVPAWQLIGPGPFDWHIAQPSFVQGGAEALLLVALVAGAFALAPARWALVIVALPLAFYLRRHAVDVPLLIDVLYLEIVVGCGQWLRRLCAAPPAKTIGDHLDAFVLGFILWSVLAWSASAVGMGSIRELRGLTLLLGIVALLGRRPPLVLFLWRGLAMQTRADRAWCGALVAWLAVSFARTNVVFGYDALWYGLRSEYVLDPGKSVFAPLGLVSPVHYFPKLYEMFLLPVSGLDDASVIDGMAILLGVLVLLAGARILDALGAPKRARLPTLALVATLPALVSAAVGPKPDIAAALFVLLAAVAAMAWTRSGAFPDLAWMLACAILGCLAKLTAVPFAGALLLAAVALAWRARGRNVPMDAPRNRQALLALAGSILVAVFVTARTLWLAGVPTIGPDVLFRLWKACGFALVDPAGTLDWTRPQDWSDVPALWIDWLLRPQRLPHVVISWVGNAWAWFALLALGAAALGQNREVRIARWPLYALVAAGLALAMGWRYHVRGSDGNYFIAALVPALLLSSAAAFGRLARMPRVFRIVLALVPAFALFQAMYSFASAGWFPGTRVMDLDLGRSWHDSRARRWSELARVGLERIGHHLRTLPPDTRGVGFAAEPASLWLPSRFEHLLAVMFARPDLLATPTAFERFLRTQRIAYLILPHADAPGKIYVAPVVASVADSLARDPAVRRFDDRSYVMFDLSDWLDRPERASGATGRTAAEPVGSAALNKELSRGDGSH
jgi:hypothetical protein